jgi:hypothetical protein
MRSNMPCTVCLFLGAERNNNPQKDMLAVAPDLHISKIMMLEMERNGKWR